MDITNIVEDLKTLTDADLEKAQLAVNAEVAVRIQNERLESRLVTALSDAQGVGFSDAEIDKIFARSREKVQKGRRDPANVPGTDVPKNRGVIFEPPVEEKPKDKK